MKGNGRERDGRGEEKKWKIGRLNILVAKSYRSYVPITNGFSGWLKAITPVFPQKVLNKLARAKVRCVVSQIPLQRLNFGSLPVYAETCVMDFWHYSRWPDVNASSNYMSRASAGDTPGQMRPTRVMTRVDLPSDRVSAALPTGTGRLSLSNPFKKTSVLPPEFF